MRASDAFRMSVSEIKDDDDDVVRVEDAGLQFFSPHQRPPRPRGAAGATADNCLYGPHTSTIRMNPYVRCVCDSGVPKIRSLQELLAQKSQLDIAEPDTPCLQPSHGPSAAWAPSCGQSSAFEPYADAALSGTPMTRNPSPEITFTADSVATPNTFATVKTHERRILSHLTKRLRCSGRHQDMPFGEPIEMVLAEVDEDEDDAEDGTEVSGLDMGGVLHTSRPCAVASHAVDFIQKQKEPGPQLLPCSTREKAEEAVRAGAVDGVEDAQTPQMSARISRSAATSHLSPLQVSHLNERIVSPHSSTGVFCATSRGSTFPERQQDQRTPDKHADASDVSSHHHHLHVRQQQQQQQQPQPSVVPPRTMYPAPVARLEESPYHYIMRNYIGGTFLYYSAQESKDYFLRLCHRVVAQVRPLLEQETLSPHYGLFPRINAPAFVFGDIHGNFEDLSFFLRRLLIFHDFNLTPANILCLGDYVDRGPFSLECVMLLFSLKIMNASKIVMLRGNHEDRVVCGDLRTYGAGCFLAQCHTVFGYTEGTKLFHEVTALFKYLPLAAELVIPSTPNLSFLRSQQTFMHPNLYVSQPAVLLHDSNRVKRTASTSSLASGTAARMSAVDSPSAHMPHRGFDAADDDKDVDDIPPPKSASSAMSPLLTGLHTIADASLERGQPSRHEAHEERILCVHGGIPRFDRPPLEENSLAFLRSLSFPRMLTLFPNNPVVKDDVECMPDYFVKHELEALWRRYPSSAPPGFTAACRREAAEAAAAPGSTTNGATSTRGVSPSSDASSCPKLSRNASPKTASGQEAAEAVVRPEPVALSRSSSCSAASSSSPAVRLGCALQSGQHEQQQQQQQRQTSPQGLRRSSDYVPQLTEDDVRKGWYTMFDLLWSDPTSTELDEEEEELARSAQGTCSVAGGPRDAHSRSCSSSPVAVARLATPHGRINKWGFSVNTRGSNVVSFSAKAVDTFLTAYHYSMLFRAHQEKAHGLRWSKSNKVLTIFSSSNYMGHRNGAGCVVVAANGEVQLIEKVVSM
ncbi:hypothetical protein JKF63_04261 [Porcisia hertigi]|uniref:protein-serine/threonine phosphatase n=1 Tax=Porcisia hertigi TaxID=2761500 RepID=A0A836IE25_9TRYP|nr:hypothetical protein JKF63_04261 [Porcisia hertigi]